jgi:hypothetical protein
VRIVVSAKNNFNLVKMCFLRVEIVFVVVVAVVVVVVGVVVVDVVDLVL